MKNVPLLKLNSLLTEIKCDGIINCREIDDINTINENLIRISIKKG